MSERTREPIVKFASIEEYKAVAKDWQQKLFLSDWIIAVGYHTQDEYPDDEGHIEFNIMDQTATITMLKEPIADKIDKYVAELILLHELLHLKIGYIEPDPSIEGTLYNICNHQLVYQMSKTLIMAKYDLDLNWFKNHERCL